MPLNTTTDFEATVYHNKRGIDRSIGYLVGGVIVMLFFLLTVLGLGRVQIMSDQAVSANPVEPEPKSAEISDSTVADPLGHGAVTPP